MHVVIALAFTLILSYVFAEAAWYKWRLPLEFAGVLRNYRVLPGFAVPAAARMLPLLEGTVALGMLVPATHAPAARAALALLLVYSAAMALNLARGRRSIDCGCGGQGQHLSEWLLLRNGLLIVLAVTVAPAVPGVPIAWYEWAIALPAAAAGCLAYHIGNQLLANADVLKALKFTNG